MTNVLSLSNLSAVSVVALPFLLIFTARIIVCDGYTLQAVHGGVNSNGLPSFTTLRPRCAKNGRMTGPMQYFIQLSMIADDSESDSGTQKGDKVIDKSKSGDPVRAALGNRPSLHPITINAIVDALKKRSQQQKKGKEDDGQQQLAFRVSDTVQPIDVAMTAGSIATSAIAKRREEQDLTGEDEHLRLTEREEQTIAGRILGVIMRLDELEQTLFERVSKVDWVSQYDEWTSFGVLEIEQVQQQQSSSSSEIVDQRIIDDPLFCLNRAECLLALFLNTVEIPQLAKAEESVPDESKIDFIDADRLEVILQEGSS